MSSGRFETYCKVSLRGRVAVDPELLVTGRSQRAIFVVLIERPRDRADRLYVVAWDERAEEVNEKIVRGQLVDVSGSARINEWEHEGKRHVRLEVHADIVRLVPKDVSSPAPSAASLQGEAAPIRDELAASGLPAEPREIRRPASNVGDDLPW